MAELTRRYIVMTMAAEAPFDPRDPEAPFVLKPWKDPAALRALETYRDHCYPELASELDAWIKVIAAGPVIRGGVGTRNQGQPANQPKVGATARRRQARPRAPLKVAERKSRTKKARRRR